MSRPRLFRESRYSLAWFSWDGSLHPGTPTGLMRAGSVVNGTWEPGIICYGIPIGTDNHCDCD